MKKYKFQTHATKCVTLKKQEIYDFLRWMKPPMTKVKKHLSTYKHENNYNHANYKISLLACVMHGFVLVIHVGDDKLKIIKTYII